MRMHQERSYVLALENTAKMEGMYLGIDENGLSFRPDENVLLLGGEATAPEKMPQAGDMPVCAGWHSAIGRKAVKLPPGLHRIA